MAHIGPYAWSAKYGTVRDSPFYGLKSGLSPTEPIFLNDRLSNQHKQLIDEDTILTEKYQREKMCGFTTRELFDLEAITLRPLKAGNLENGIIPFLDKQNWEDIGSVKKVWLNVDNPNAPVFFSVEDPSVWRVLQPVLVLASRIIQDATMQSYFKAFFNSSREPVTRDRIPQEILDGTAGDEAPSPEELRTIHNYFNPNPDEAQFCLLTDTLFLKMKGILRLGFKDGKVDPLDGKTEQKSHGRAYGYCYAQEAEDDVVQRIWIFLDYRDYRHLLKNDLTDCDRMGLQWFNASVLVHELGHAFDYLISTQVIRSGRDWAGLSGLKDPFEPYFENEALAELGFAMEKSVFGGIVDAMHPTYHKRKQDVLPLGYWFDPHWPAVHHRDCIDKHSPTLKTPLLSNERHVYPMPAQLVEDIQREDFWSVAVRKFGFKVLQLRSVDVRRQFNYGLDQQITSTDLVIAQRFPWDTLNNDLLQLAGQGQEARDAFNFAKGMYARARQAERYWVMNKKQNEQVEKILQQLQAQQDPSNPHKIPLQNQQNFFQVQIAYLGLAITAHGKVVDELLALEAQKENTQDIYQERRYTLLTFNRGTRIFARQLRVVMQSNNYIVEARIIELKELELECSWMKLYSRPDLDFCGTNEDEQEYTRLHQISESYQAGNLVIHQQIQTLENSPGLSWVWMCLMKMLRGASSPKTVPAVQRYNEIKTGVEDLIKIRDEAAQSSLWPTWWKENLDSKIQFGKDRMAVISSEIHHV